MKRNNITLPLASLFVAAMTSVASGDTHAYPARRILHQNPTGVCQSALPVYDGQIRKRPKAVQNEGASPAFVTCSWSVQNNPESESWDGVQGLTIYFSIDDGVPDAVRCTAILGSDAETFPTYMRATDLHPNGTQRSLVWGPEDFGGALFFPSSLVSVTCLLNPGVGINHSELMFFEEIGN